MKNLKVMMVVLIAVAFILPLAAQEANAAPATPVCWVNYIGVNTAGQKLIQLTDTAATPAWTGKRYFVLSNVTTNDVSIMVSTGLTAMASGMKVQALLADTVAGSACTGIVLLDQ
jgi:hypothetical protein